MDIQDVKVCPHCGGDNLSEGSEIGLSYCWGCERDGESVLVKVDLDAGEVA